MSLSQELLLAIDEMPIKEKYVKLELLNWQEEPIREIQGTLTGGTLNINGDSTVRRTCSLSFLITGQKNLEDYISLNAKFRLFIGLKNHLLSPYKEQAEDIIWFNEGLYVFTGASFSKSSNGTRVNVTAKDKGCLLNGDVAGIIPETVNFHEAELEDENGDIYYEQLLIFNIIQELVHHYGGEKMSNIYIADIPLQIRQLMSYEGSRPIYIQTASDEEGGAYTSHYSWDALEGYEMFEAGDQIGYVLKDFVYPGELIAAPGDTVAGVLDKIKNTLGNFEYFYDVDGHFHFQEIRNYLNNSFEPISAIKDEDLDITDYQANFDLEETIYSFKDNKKLISALSNNPNYSNIKNDFVVWGVRKTASGVEVPIRYHLAIDSKPTQSEIKEITGNANANWREAIYQYCQNGEDKDEVGWDYYKKELDAEWRNLYDGTEWVYGDSKTVNFFFDFIDEDSAWGEYSVNKIGRRTYAEENDDCVYVFTKEVPDIIFCATKEERDAVAATGEYNYVSLADSSLLNALTASESIQSCFDRVRELLYQYLTLNETITITALPIYWLEANRKIEVEDNDSRIYGEYMIKSISIPLSYSGTMSIQATRALSRL